MSDTVTFKYYPTTNRVPGVYAEVDPNQANTGQVNQRTLLIGQKLASGLAPAGMPYLYSSAGDSHTAFGVGSQLDIMCARYRAIDGFGELWCLPLADDGASVAATGTLTMAGTATAVGVVSLYVAGNVVSTAVSIGDTAATVATNIVAAIAQQPTLPVTAASAGAVVTLTARNKGPGRQRHRSPGELPRRALRGGAGPG